MYMASIAFNISSLTFVLVDKQKHMAHLSHNISSLVTCIKIIIRTNFGTRKKCPWKQVAEK